MNSDRHGHVYSFLQQYIATCTLVPIFKVLFMYSMSCTVGTRKITTFCAQVTAVFFGLELKTSLHLTNKNVANTITETLMKEDSLQL